MNLATPYKERLCILVWQPVGFGLYCDAICRQSLTDWAILAFRYTSVRVNHAVCVSPLKQTQRLFTAALYAGPPLPRLARHMDARLFARRQCERLDPNSKCWLDKFARMELGFDAAYGRWARECAGLILFGESHP